MSEPATPDCIQTWNEFWAPICAPDGQLNLDQVMRELHDFKGMMRSVSEVYCHISGDKLSKPNYEAAVVIQVADERVQDLIHEAVKEATEEQDATP
jgi:hypothetical protein